MDRKPLGTTVFSTRQLVMFAGASGDFSEYHYDADVARSVGHPAVLVHGRLQLAVLERFALEHGSTSDPPLRIARWSARYMKPAYPRVTLTGFVAAANESASASTLTFWMEDPDGRRTTQLQVTYEPFAPNSEAQQDLPGQ